MRRMRRLPRKRREILPSMRKASVCRVFKLRRDQCGQRVLLFRVRNQTLRGQKVRKQLSNLLPTILVGALFLAAWVVIILMMTDLPAIKPLGWFGFSFVIFSFLVAFAANWYTANRIPRNDVSLFAIPLYYTIAFLVLSMAVNTAFLLLRLVSLVKVLVAIDVILLVVYLAAMYFTSSHLASVQTKSIVADSQTGSAAQLSAEIARLAGIAPYPEIKNSLLKLKETVDFSTNTVGTAADGDAHTVSLQLERLRQAMQNKAQPAELQQIVSEAVSTWRSRNASIS